MGAARIAVRLQPRASREEIVGVRDKLVQVEGIELPALAAALTAGA